MRHWIEIYLAAKSQCRIGKLSPATASLSEEQDRLPVYVNTRDSQKDRISATFSTNLLDSPEGDSRLDKINERSWDSQQGEFDFIEHCNLCVGLDFNGNMLQTNDLSNFPVSFKFKTVFARSNYRGESNRWRQCLSPNYHKMIEGNKGHYNGRYIP